MRASAAQLSLLRLSHNVAMVQEHTQILAAPGAERAAGSGFAGAEACPHCSSSIPAGAEFCLNCGYQRGSWPAASKAADAQVHTSAAAAPGPFVLLAADGREFNLPLGESIIGRGDVSLRIDDSYISRQHARVAVSGDSVLLTDLGSSNGTSYAGAPLAPHAPVSLLPGTSFALGQLELTLQPNPAYLKSDEAQDPGAEETPAAVIDAAEPGPSAPPMKSSSGWLLVGAALSFDLPLGTVSCGRKAEANDIVIPDGYISGKHCTLEATSESLVITDQGSTNGSFVNAVQLEAGTSQELRPGDQLRLGQLELTVQKADLGDGGEQAGADASADPAEA